MIEIELRKYMIQLSDTFGQHFGQHIGKQGKQKGPKVEICE